MKHVALFLRDIYFGKKSGRLVFKRGDIEKYFFFQEGDLLQVKTNQPEERLGEVLFRLEKISRDAHSRMDDFIEPQTNIGEVLKSKGLISEADLEEALVYQLRETTLNTFPYFDADMVFQERPAPPGGQGRPQDQRPLPHRIRDPAHGLRSGPQGLPGEEDPPAARAVDGPPPDRRGEEDPERDQGRRARPKRSRRASPSRRRPSGRASSSSSAWISSISSRRPLRRRRRARLRTRPAGPPRPARRRRRSPTSSRCSESLATKTYYQILDVPRTATEEEIKKAYFNLARRFHPDRFDRNVQAAHRDQIDEVFDAITNAYRTLINREKRKAYDAGSGGTRRGARGRHEEGGHQVPAGEDPLHPGALRRRRLPARGGRPHPEEQGRLLPAPGHGRVQDRGLQQEGRGGFSQGHQPRALESRGLCRAGLSLQERRA